VPGATVLEGALEGFSRTSFTSRGKTRALYRTGAGPAVIVMSEIPGITPLVASFARRVAAIGCTAVLPQLFGIPGAEPTPRLMARTVAGACISRELWR
jgi:dienelactone hydrolase